SRRRHTRFSRDWSSDVCSSDLGRTEILKVHTRRVPLAPDVDLEEIAASMPGFSGADIRNLVNEAALLAARRDQDSVYQKDFLDRSEERRVGKERKHQSHAYH